MAKPASETVTVLTPVFDDWTSCRTLLSDLDEVFAGRPERFRVLVVDDGSVESHAGAFQGLDLRCIEAVDVLRLTRNQGHQRAIAVGLTHLAKDPPERVVVMDADGEDAPSDVPRLLEQSGRSSTDEIVFAARTKRAEGFVFRVCYLLFKLVHRLLVGRGVRVGNFSVVPRRRLLSLVTVSELWSHYAAAVIASRQPVALVPCARAQRIDGHSRMNFVGLVTHGLGAISVYSEIVATRLLFAAGVLGALSVTGILAVGGLLLFTDPALPGWTVLLLAVLLVLLLQAMLSAFAMTFTLLSQRSGGGFLPIRDCPWFVEREISVFIRPVTQEEAASA